MNRHGEVPCTFRGYRLRAGDETRPGLRATPAVSASHGVGRRARGGRALLAELPEGDRGGRPQPHAPPLAAPVRRPARDPGRRAEDAQLHAGVRATIRCRATPLYWGRAPSIAAATPRVVCAAEAVAYLTPACRRRRRTIPAAGRRRDRRRRGVRAQARVDRRVRLAALRRHLRRPREPVQRSRPSRSSRTTTTSTTRCTASRAQFMRTGDAAGGG